MPETKAAPQARPLLRAGAEVRQGGVWSEDHSIPPYEKLSFTCETRILATRSESGRQVRYWIPVVVSERVSL